MRTSVSAQRRNHLDPASRVVPSERDRVGYQHDELDLQCVSRMGQKKIVQTYSATIDIMILEPLMRSKAQRIAVHGLSLLCR
jgi:hypothetical protein